MTFHQNKIAKRSTAKKLRKGAVRESGDKSFYPESPRALRKQLMPLEKSVERTHYRLGVEIIHL